MSRAIAKFLLSLFGWKVDETVPPEAQRSVMLAAPHTSNWDAILTRVAFYVLGIPVKIAIKDYWTTGFWGIFVRPFGVLGIDRSPKDPNNPRPSQIEQMAAFFGQYETMALVIAPEGTRRLRPQWKMGPYYTAKLANVPITFGYLDFKTKTAGVGDKALYLTDDLAADMRVVMDFYKDITPKYPEKFMVDERYS